MRIVIAMMKHETNTFSPIVTDWDRFKQWGAYEGLAVQQIYGGTGMPVAAYIKLAQARGAGCPPQVQPAPGTPHRPAVLPHFTLAFAIDFQATAIDHHVAWFVRCSSRQHTGPTARRTLPYFKTGMQQSRNKL